MKKMMQKGLVMCLSAALLGGCGSGDDRKVGLEDIEQSLSDVQQGTKADEGERGSDVSEGAGESGLGISENGGGDAGQDSTGGQDAPGQAEQAEQTLSQEQEAMYKAYVTVLEDVYFDGKFPGYTEYGPSPEGYDASDNMFAVFDVDFDGKEELIISYTATYSSGMVELVYGYDSSTGSVQQELLAYPHLTYYDNGVVEEMASHNHGMASDGGADGNFWPYSLRRYNAEADAYVPVGSVDAWSKGFREEDYDGNPFPEDADTDGDGVVYYVMEGDYALIDPMDGAEYNQWRDSYLKETKQVQIPYVNLTTDNIYAICIKVPHKDL